MKYVLKRRRARWTAAVIDAAGWFCFAFFRRRPARGSMSLDGKTLLVVRLDHIGDALLTTGVPRAVKEHYPGCRLLLLVSSRSKALFERNPFVDEVLVYDAPWFARGAAPGPGALGLPELLRTLRKRRPDAGVSLRGDARENALLFAAGVRRRVGYGITGGGFLLTDPCRYPERAHEVERIAELLRVWGIRGPMRPALYFSTEEEEWATDWLARRGVVPGERLVGFQLFAGTTAKEWSPLRRLKFLEEVLPRLGGAKPIFVGSDADRIRLDRELTESGRTRLLADAQALVAAGELTLRQTCLVLRRCALFFGPDSGPAHIASALGVKTHFLYSGTNAYDSWRPLAEDAVVWRTQAPCAPCGLRVCPVPGHPCVDGTDPSTVVEALAKDLNR